MYLKIIYRYIENLLYHRNLFFPSLLMISFFFQFKDQVVREAVEKICHEFSGQCCIHKPLGGGGGAGGGGVSGGEAVGGAESHQVPEVSSSTLPGAPSSSTPACSSCRGQTTGGGYQCRCVMSVWTAWTMINHDQLSFKVTEMV